MAQIYIANIIEYCLRPEFDSKENEMKLNQAN